MVYEHSHLYKAQLRPCGFYLCMCACVCVRSPYSAHSAVGMLKGGTQHRVLSYYKSEEIKIINDP